MSDARGSPGGSSSHPPTPTVRSDSDAKSASSSTRDTTSVPEPTPNHPCLLFRLPRELRAQIFEHALTSSGAICWPAKKKWTAAREGGPELTPALLRTSRAVYSEAAPILYGRNTFTFPHPSDANMFRVVASPAFSGAVARIQLAVRERDVHLWSAYLGSTRAERSLQADYPGLRALRIAFPSSFWSPLRGELSESYFRWQNDPRLREICLSLENKYPVGVVKVVCAHALPEQNVRELAQSYPAELWADEVGVVRLKQTVKLFNAIVGLELIPVRTG